MEKNKKEELQSRRDFFKKAAKSALPILGVIALSQIGLTSCGDDDDDEPLSCKGCSGGCSNSCSGDCDGGCTNNCDGMCGCDCWAYCQSTAKR